MTLSPPFVGFWKCCECARDVAHDVWGDYCPDDQHYRCENCGEYGDTDIDKSTEIPEGSSPVLEVSNIVSGATNKDHDEASYPSAPSTARIVGSQSLSDHPLREDSSGHNAQLESHQHKTKIDEEGKTAREILSYSPIGLSRVPSLQSLADSLFSTVSGSSKSSVKGPEGASERLASVIFEDEVLQPLLHQAAEKILLDRLERNLRRLLKAFSKHLLEESTSNIERCAARFVRTQARKSAYLICNELDPSGERSRSSKKQSDEISESEPDEDGDELVDLDNFETFILKSVAFKRLRDNIRQFVNPLPTSSRESRELVAQELFSLLPFAESTPLDAVSSTGIVAKSIFERSLKWVKKTVNRLFKDPPIAKGMKRVRWTCSCGEILHDDYEELEKGAATRFQTTLRRSFRRNQIHQHFDPHHTTNGIFRSCKVFALFLITLLPFPHEKGPSESAELPTFEQQPHPSSGNPGQSPVTPQLFLLLCINDGIGASTTRAHQPAVHDMDSDKKLFHMFGAYYTSIQKRWWSWLSLWELQHIYFVFFEMYDKSLVDIKELNVIPPAELNTLYRYEPSKLKPPIGSNLLMHYFRYPEDAPSVTPCFRKMPKKMNQKLTVCPVRGVSPGWGLHFVEGWNWNKILTVSCFVFILASTVVGVLYWKFEHSIQDAFTIGTFMLACFAVGMGTLQAWSSIA